MSQKITCANCGHDLPPDDPPDEKWPCPQCGSTKRVYKLHAEAGRFGLSGSDVTFNVIRDVSSVIVQGLLIPHEKTSEGLLIRAVAPAWFEIIRLLQENPEAAFEIPARKWEEIVAGAYDAAGFDEVTLTPASGDLGRDVIAVKRGIGQVRVIDQVKAYKPGHLVTANDVRALMGVLHEDGASKGFVTTTSDFAPKIKDDPLIVPLIPARLDLINGEKLLTRLSELMGDLSESAQ